MAYEPRTYRRSIEAGDLVSFEVVVKETDLQVPAVSELRDLTEDLIVQARWQIESFIRTNPRFEEAMSPYEVPDDAPELVRKMAEAAKVANVGPMAAVAGAVAEYVARGLSEQSPEVIVENGGDIYLVGQSERTVSVLAGDSPLSGKVGLRITKGLLPVAVCTSSGTVGHSLSLGSADAVTVIAHSGALADAAASALGNRVHGEEDLEEVAGSGLFIPGVLGVVAVAKGTLAAWGNVHLVPMA